MTTAASPAAVIVVPAEDHDDLEGAFQRAVQTLPGLLPSRLPDQVLIKPNLCDIVSWDHGVTTDPRWVGVLSKALRHIREDVRIRIIESDAISAYRVRRSCRETFHRLGYSEAAEAAGVELVDLSRADSLLVRMAGLPEPVRVPELFLGEMFLISVANLKVHPYERMTGVMKNSLGLLSDADISGHHAWLPEVITGLHRYAPPDLCIIDARIGLEGIGPIIGHPVRTDTLIVGNDALAVDETACRIMDVEPRLVPHLAHAARSMGRTLGQVRVLGEVRVRPFVFDPGNIHKTIRTKFASRRIHKRFEVAANTWISRFYRFKRSPGSFLKGVARRLAGGSSGK